MDRLPSYYLYRVNMKLVSPDQPDVQSLICSRKSGTYGIAFIARIFLRSNQPSR
jgi:hypothetical protein